MFIPETRSSMIASLDNRDFEPARAELQRKNWKIYEKHEALIVAKDNYPA